MPRINKRNFTDVFELMDLDRTGLGPKVSDDIQLTYNMGDWERFTQTQLAGSSFTFPLAGESGFLEIEVLAPKGLIFWTFTETAPVVANVNLNFWLLRTQAFPVTSGDRVETGWSVIEGAAPLSRLFGGHTADAKLGLVYKRGVLDTGLYPPLYAGTPGLWVRNGRFLVMHSNQNNQIFSPTVICSELGRDASPIT